MSLFLSFIITGFIIGLIASAIKPGDQSMSMGKTSVLGMAGGLFGGWVGYIFGFYEPDEGAGFILATVGAVAVLVIYYAMTRHDIEHKHRDKIGHT